MLDVNNLELKLRVIESEIRESEREKEKLWDAVIGSVFGFICLLGVGLYTLIKQSNERLWIIPVYGLALFFALLCPFLIYYWYDKYKNKKKQLEKLERELYLLKKGLKKD